MLRSLSIAGLGLTLLSVNALAQPAPQDAPPPASQYSDLQQPPASGRSAGDDRYAQNDLLCRRDAWARAGGESPGEAARDEQTRDTVTGGVLGAAAGALIGSASGHAGAGAAIGGGAGLIAGAAAGADNGRAAAGDAEQRYAALYYQCMAAGGAPPRPGQYAYENSPPPPGAYDYPPPPYPYYGPYPYYPYGYPPAYYGYGPFVPTFSFGFYGHGGRGWHHR